jgi:hypothetical protein
VLLVLKHVLNNHPQFFGRIALFLLWLLYCVLVVKPIYTFLIQHSGHQFFLIL